MRETLKSLAVFSASLLLILTVSSGCVVNIPGCGKRALPLFKPVSSASPAQSISVPPAASAPETTPIAQPTDSSSIGSLAPSNPPAETANPLEADVPVVIPEEERIAYTTSENGSWSLRDISVDGSRGRDLSPSNTNNWFPLWSPNGKFLAFLSDQNKGKVNLFVLTKTTGEAKQVTHFDDMSIPREYPMQPPLTWSPRSDQIAFLYNNQVMLVDLTTEVTTTLAHVETSYQLESIAWAPRRDNKYVAYMVKHEKNLHSFWLVNPRLKDQIELTEIKMPSGPFAWTPDAARLDYIVGDSNIYEVAYETLKEKSLLSNVTAQFGPILEYAPVDGSSHLLVLAKQNPKDSDFSVALLDKPAASQKETGSLKYLTSPGAEFATWSPDGTKILYLMDGALWVMDITGANKKLILLAGIKTPTWSKK